jgi:hypothetical protein
VFADVVERYGKYGAVELVYGVEDEKNDKRAQAILAQRRCGTSRG